jgi:hypothetical protein
VRGAADPLAGPAEGPAEGLAVAAQAVNYFFHSSSKKGGYSLG